VSSYGSHAAHGIDEPPAAWRPWRVDRRRAGAGVLHGRPLPDHVERSVWVHEVDRPALVLGSTQDDGVVDRRVAAALGIEVVRRRSGGGVVLLVPGEVAWLDVIVPHGDPLWDDDVSRAGQWLGRAWQGALTDLGIIGATVHTGPLACGALGRLVCFAAVGPGEVTLGERKLVGVSQRRTRAAARFQCAVYRRWTADLLVPLLGLDEEVGRALQGAATGVGAPPGEVVDAFLRHLPT
jgi:lipoate-protein ligase A